MKSHPLRSNAATALAIAGALLLSPGEPVRARSPQPSGAPAAMPPATPGSAAPSPVPSSPAPGSAATLTATVRSYDARTRTLEVITGVGLALRVVKIACPEGTPVRAEAAAASIARLKPGDIVRVEYARAPEGNVAKSIEALPKPGVGGAP
jgi:hypothetical protein